MTNKSLLMNSLDNNSSVDGSCHIAPSKINFGKIKEQLGSIESKINKFGITKETSKS